MWSTSLQSGGWKRNVIEFLEVQQELFFVLENPLKYNGFKHYLIDSYCCSLEQYWQWMKEHVLLSHSVLSCWTVQEKSAGAWGTMASCCQYGPFRDPYCQGGKFHSELNCFKWKLFCLNYIIWGMESLPGELCFDFCIICKFLWFPGAFLFCYFSLHTFGARWIAGRGGIPFTIFRSLSWNSKWAKALQQHLQHSSCEIAFSCAFICLFL